MLLKQCCQELERLGLKIAFIESASSGYLSTQFSIHKNTGADILLGGLVSYDPSIKIQLLKIPATLIEMYTAESIAVTHAMALQGHLLFNTADLIVACTGLLKPGGSASSEKPEGSFFIAIYYAGQITDYSHMLNGTPQQRLDQLVHLVAQHVLHTIMSKPISET